MIGLFAQKQKGYQPSPSTTIIPPPPPRTGGTIKKESQVFIKPEDFERLLQEWIETEPEGFVVDEDKIEELEDYIEYRRKLRELTRKMVEEELERYIVEEKSLEYYDGEIDYRKLTVNCNETNIGYIKMYNIQGAWCVTRIDSFKYIMAALGNSIISHAFQKNDKDIYINYAQYILEQGGTIDYPGVPPYHSDLKITLREKA